MDVYEVHDQPMLVPRVPQAEVEAHETALSLGAGVVMPLLAVHDFPAQQLLGLLEGAMLVSRAGRGRGLRPVGVPVPFSWRYATFGMYWWACTAVAIHIPHRL